MDKYFEQNKYDGNDFIDLHHELTRACSVVASNLFFHEAKDDLKSPEHRLKLAKARSGLSLSARRLSASSVKTSVRRR